MNGHLDYDPWYNNFKMFLTYWFMSSQHRTGLSGLTDNNLLRDRMGLEEELRSRMGLNIGIEEEFRNRMGMINSIGDELRGRMGLNMSMEEELRNRMGLSNGLSEEVRNRIGGNISIEDELRRSMGGSNNLEEELRNRIGLGSDMAEELQSRVGVSSSAEDELRNRIEMDSRVEQNRMAFYNSVESIRQQQNQNFDKTFQQKHGQQMDKESETNSSHLDETIEAVARNQFDYEPVIKPEMRNSCNQFMDNFSVKQEPVDYDLMAANLTAGLMNPDRRHMCAHCCKGFRSRQQLLQHSLVHTNLRKYHCNYCERSFKQLSHLHQHHRIHTGEKPYSCPLDGCDKAFPQLSNLQHHIRNHDKLSESQYQCHLCDRSYPNEATLKAHNTRMHVHSKLISDLQKPSLSQPTLSVSQSPVVSNMQPRQRKRKATRPQHINSRSVIPFSPSRSEMFSNSQMKHGQDDYVYILDSDDDDYDDDSENIPSKKSATSRSNNDEFYDQNLMQKENFYARQRLENGHSKTMPTSESNEKFYQSNSSVIQDSNFRYLNDIAHLRSSEARSHVLPKLSSELQRNDNHVTSSSNEMFQINNNLSVSSSGISDYKNHLNLSSNEISRNNSYLLDSSNEMSRNNYRSINSNGISSSSNRMTGSSNGIQRSQLSNEMQQYRDGVGLDLSTGSHDLSRQYNDRSKIMSGMSNETYSNNHTQRINGGMSNNQRMMEDKQNQNFTNSMMSQNTNDFNQMMSKNVNSWQRRNYISQKMENRDSEESTDESELEMDGHHFQTPNLGTDVYDDPMN